MFFLYICVISLVVTLGSSDDVTVECIKCRNGGDSLNAVEGDDLTVRYTIENKDFANINVSYNESNILSANSSGAIKQNKFIDKRFLIPSDLTKGGNNKFMFEFNLTELTDKDDGRMFHYKLKLTNGSFIAGRNMLTIDPGNAFSFPSIPLAVLISVLAMVIIFVGKVVVKYNKRNGRLFGHE